MTLLLSFNWISYNALVVLSESLEVTKTNSLQFTFICCTIDWVPTTEFKYSLLNAHSQELWST